MANLKITNVPQTSVVVSTDDLYIKTGSNFRRVPVSKLVELLESLSFYEKPMNGIPQDDLCTEQVVISPSESGFVSSRTYSQISASAEAGAEILPEFRPNESQWLRGIVIDITDSAAILAFLIPGERPYISVFTVMDLTVSQAKISIGGPVEVTLSGSTVTIDEAQDNTVYICGEVSALTVAARATSAAFTLVFDSPAGTPTILTMPYTNVYMPAGFIVEPYGHVEINVDKNGYALAAFWPFD